MKKKQRVVSKESELRAQCKERGIEPSSNPTLMAERIRLHDEGKLVLLTNLKQRTTPFIPPVPAEVEKFRQATPIYARGELQLLGVPHDVLRTNHFAYLPALDLIHMLRVCKYVFQDAYAVLQQRAAFWFSFSGGVTPLALSAWCYYEYRYHLLAVYYARSYGFPKHEDYSLLETINCALAEYGSLEGFQMEIRRRKMLVRAKANEKSAIFQGIPQRYRECMDIMEQMQCPNVLFDYDAANKKFTYRPLWFKMHDYMFSPAQKEMLGVMRKFVTRGSPATLVYVPELRLTRVQQQLVNCFYTVFDRLRRSSSPEQNSVVLVRRWFMFHCSAYVLTDAQVTSQLEFCATHMRSPYTGFASVFIWNINDVARVPEAHIISFSTVATVFDLCHFLGLRMLCTEARIHICNAFEERREVTVRWPLTPDLEAVSVRQCHFLVIFLQN